MECTSCGENCPFVKAKLCSSEKDCPNYLESWWQENGQGQPKIIKDCAPKRLLIQQQTEVNRIFALQQAIEEMRNKFLVIESSLSQLITQSQQYIAQEVKLLEAPKISNKSKQKLKQISSKK
jgi:hypothetical protein